MGSFTLLSDSAWRWMGCLFMIGVATAIAVGCTLIGGVIYALYVGLTTIFGA